MADRVLVIGVGNELRGDDGAGIEVARRLRKCAITVREHQGEPTALLEAWRDADAVLVIDSMRSGQPAGTIRRFDASRDRLPARLRGSSSTHAFTLSQAIELARALQRLPKHVIVFAIEGRCFAAGAPLSEDLERSIPALAEAVRREALTPTGT